jgi:hypothetical protein
MHRSRAVAIVSGRRGFQGEFRRAFPPFPADWQHTTDRRRMQSAGVGPGSIAFDAQEFCWIPTNYSRSIGCQRIFERGLKFIQMQGLVARTGVEPVIFALKGRRVNHYSTGPHGITRGEPYV